MAWEQTEVLEFAGLLRSLLVDLRGFDPLRPPMAPEEAPGWLPWRAGFELLYCISGMYLNREAGPPFK